MRNPKVTVTAKMTVRSILSFSKIPVFSAVFIVGSFLLGASNNYVALFSDEEDDFRRIVLDGAADRRVEVDLDDLGQAEIKVWGVSEQSYVGRRLYQSGYLLVKVKIFKMTFSL